MSTDRKSNGRGTQVSHMWVTAEAVGFIVVEVKIKEHLHSSVIVYLTYFSLCCCSTDRCLFSSSLPSLI